MTLQRALVRGLPAINCASYGVMIVDKVTRATVARLPETGWELTYDYQIDRTSEAQLTVNVGPGGVGADCCAQLGRIGHWMHELVVFREGSNREVWGGPVTKLRESPGDGTFTVQAKDRSAWWWRRALPYDLTYSGGSRADATRVFMDLLKAAEQTTGSTAWKLPYDPVRLNVSGRETGVIIDGKVLTASDIVMIGPEIQTLSDSVIDWTVIGRTCYVGSLVIELDPLPILAQDHWLEMDPEIEWDGEQVATQVVMMGARGIMGIWPAGPISHPRWPQYGSHTLRLSDPKITDQRLATEAARTAWDLHQQPALCVLSAGGSLGPNAPVIPQDLVPGRVTNVGFDTSCFITGTRLAQTRENGVLQYVAYDSGVPRDLVIPQRITKTTVRVVDSQEVSVLVDLQPPGTADIRRPGGRSERQPTGQTGGPPFCLVLESGDAFADPALLFTGGPGNSCSAAGYYGLGYTFDEEPWTISWDFTLTPDQAGELNALGYLMLRAEFLVPTGPPIDSIQAVYQLNDEASSSLVGLLPEVSTGAPPSGGAPPVGPMTQPPSQIPVTGFVVGLNTFTVTLVDLDDTVDQTIELLKVDEMALGNITLPSLWVDSSDCLTCTEPEEVDSWCALRGINDGDEIGTVGDFDDHPGLCSEGQSFSTFNETGDGMSWDFTPTDFTFFNTGWFGIIGQQYTSGDPAVFTLTINGFSYTLEADDEPGVGFPIHPLADIGSGDWTFRRYNTADIVADEPFQSGVNHVELVISDQGDVNLAGRVEFAGLVFGPTTDEGGCMEQTGMCFSCTDPCNQIFET